MRSVEITCPNHPEPHVVYAFFNDDDGKGWQPPYSNRTSARPLKGFDSTLEVLVGDTYVGNRPKLHPMFMGRPGSRTRYSFQCRLCGGDSLPVRSEKLEPILERLSAAGVDSITIQGLSSILV